ncbi:MAG: methyltransferase domain-containing protein, partial [Desulfobacterales bacterium]|nr:methyltransferase domain-containing protein [Desulfobacterales bacterium]
MKSEASLARELPEPFNFYSMIISSGHLHFGLWPDESPELTLEQAQDKMFEALLGYIPDTPAALLDVGCGLGFSAYRLSREGYRVFAIAPSEAMIRYASRRYGGDDGDFKP